LRLLKLRLQSLIQRFDFLKFDLLQLCLFKFVDSLFLDLVDLLLALLDFGVELSALLSLRFVLIVKLLTLALQLLNYLVAFSDFVFD
jgi:hypothetical protein